MTALSTETQGENQDTRLIPLSALQHYALCPRQCALIHNEQAWAENYLTAQGRALRAYGVHVAAEKLGISGVLDLVEVETKTGRMKPVEYKCGKPKPDPMDQIQLCAQGLCLEEMTGQTVSEGALWYMQTRHRVSIVFSDDLRAQTLATIAAVRELLNSGQTRRPTTANAAKPARWWRFASRSCWGSEIGVWGMWRGCLGNRGNLSISYS